MCLDIAMSRSQLYRKIKSLTGLTPKQYIDQIRYHQARLLLEENRNMSVKRIAYKVGFKDEEKINNTKLISLIITKCVYLKFWQVKHKM